MAILEGRWNCADCGTQEILGRHKNCPKCGHTRNPIAQPSEEPYLPGDAEEVTDPELLELNDAGADKVCDHCGSSFRGDTGSCPKCGDTSSDEDKEWLQYERVKKAVSNISTSVSAKVGTRNHLAWAAALGGSVLLSWLIYFFFFASSAVLLEVSQLDWEREQEIEEYRTLVEEGWSVPARGRELDSYRAVRSYRQEFSHYETKTRQVSHQVPETTYVSRTCTRSNGNGFFESYECGSTQTTYRIEYTTETYQDAVYVSVPVYDTKYEYEIDRWVTDRWVATSNTLNPDKDPFFASPGLEPKQRIGDEQKETYEVYLTGFEEKTFQEEVSFDIWTTLEVGQQVTGKINRQGSLLDVIWEEQ